MRTISGPFAAGTVVILLTAVAGVITSMFPSDVFPWVAPVVAAITAFAALVKVEFKAETAGGE